MNLSTVFTWFQEDKLLKKFQDLRSGAEKIAGDMAAEIATEKLSAIDWQSIYEEAVAASATMDALADLARHHRSKIGAVISTKKEQIELMTDTRRKFIDLWDRTNDAATIASNAGEYFLANPEAAAQLLAAFNPKVLRLACDILADREDWATLGMLSDVATAKLEGRPE